MEEKKENRQKWLHVRLTDAEFNLIQKHYQTTTEPKISSYIRNLILAKPMICGYRNQSLKDIISTLAELRMDLNGIANNYNQMLHKLHTLDRHQDIKAWVLSYELQKKTLMNSISEIKIFIDKTADKWLQS